MRFVLGLCALAALGSAASARNAGAQASPAGADISRGSDAARPAADSLRLTRRQAIAQALTNSPLLTVAREQTAEARARRVEALSIPDPLLTYSYDEQQRLFNFGAAGQRNVGVGLTIPFPDKLRLQGSAATAGIRASEANFHLVQQQLAAQTSATYDSLLVALRHRSDLQQARGLSTGFLTRTEARFNAGTAAKLDVIKARVDVAQAQNDLIANEAEIANAQASLNRLLGRLVGAPVAPMDSLTLPPPLPDSATIEEIAIANRPELAILAQQQRGASATTSLLREFWIPDFTLGFTRDNLVPGSAAFSTGITMNVPAFFWQHTNGTIAESQHTERELAASYRDLRTQVMQDVRSAYANASTAIRQANFLQTELVPAASEAFRVASVSYTIGGSSALEVLQARRDLLDAQRQLSDALAAANTARADLERALGVPLSTLGVPNP
jgi:outer membrane protein TolC